MKNGYRFAQKWGTHENCNFQGNSEDKPLRFGVQYAIFKQTQVPVST